MPTVQPVLLEEANRSFERLKHEAKNLDDVAQWFAANTHLLELPDGAIVESVKANVSYVQMFDIFFEEDQNQLRMSVEVKVALDPSIIPVFFAALDAKARDVRPKSERWSFPIVLTDWSFAIARLAHHFLEARGYEHQTHPSYIACKACLDVQLPRHFGGLTIDTLRALSDGGLLDPSSSDFYDKLFSARCDTNHSKELPNDVGNTSFGYQS